MYHHHHLSSSSGTSLAEHSRLYDWASSGTLLRSLSRRLPAFGLCYLRSSQSFEPSFVMVDLAVFASPGGEGLMGGCEWPCHGSAQAVLPNNRSHLVVIECLAVGRFRA